MKDKENKRTNICLIGASFETWNMGVSALAEASITCIIHRWPEVELKLLGSYRFNEHHCMKFVNEGVKITNIPINYSRNIFLPNHFFRIILYIILLRLLPFGPLKRLLMRHNSCLSSVLQTDLFADITGGDSFSDIYGVRRFVWGFLPKLLPILSNKELVLLPQTYGPFKSHLTRLIARYILRQTRTIYSRDSASAEYVRGLLDSTVYQSKVRIVPDIAFVLNTQKPASLDVGCLTEVRTNGSQVVGLNVSGLLYQGGYTGNNMFGLREDYREVVYRVVEYFLTNKNVLVLLVPHVFPPTGTVGAELAEDDFAACRDVYGRFVREWPSRVFIAQGNYDQNEIKYIIGLCDFFIGSRMHSCIAALSQKIPAVGLAYSRKFSGVFETVGVGELVVDLRSETKDGIIAFIEKVYSEREMIVQKLSQTIPKAQEAVLKIFNLNLQ